MFISKLQASDPDEVAKQLGREVHLTAAMVKALTDFLKLELCNRSEGS